MIHALGYSQSPFDAADAGRLCRGRERWIEPYDLPGPVPLHRAVISGATFTDDSARDALRGLPFAKVPAPDLLLAVLPPGPLIAFMEDGHPADIPELATDVEVYLGHRAGGRVQEPMVRWIMRVEGRDAVRELLGDDGSSDRVRGFLVLAQSPEPPDSSAQTHAGSERPDGLDPALVQAIFLLTGMSTLDSPPAQFQPAALGEVLAHGPAVALVHRDKHGTALGVYSTHEIDVVRAVAPLAQQHGALLVPFAIPPMLARWDRALAELRQDWMATRSDEFPVPPAPEQPPWRGRRGRWSERDTDDGGVEE